MLIVFSDSEPLCYLGLELHDFQKLRVKKAKKTNFSSREKMCFILQGLPLLLYQKNISGGGTAKSIVKGARVFRSKNQMLNLLYRQGLDFDKKRRVADCLKLQIILYYTERNSCQIKNGSSRVSTQSVRVDKRTFLVL